MQKSSAEIDHVVITPSITTVLDPLKGLRPGYNYTESDWNPVTKEAVLQRGDGVLSYLALKTFSEKAAFDFIKKTTRQATSSYVS